jgi:phage terminase large subunit GpA-like protein
MANGDLDFLREQFGALTDEVCTISPSQWAEQHRHLSPAVTANPGPYSFDLTPYLRDVLDDLGIESPVREVVLMKGVQLGATTLGENWLGYVIDVVRSAPIYLISATDILVKKRMDMHVMPMIESSGLVDQLQSTDTTNARKAGRTEKQVSWVGGGSLLPTGANSAANLRSLPAPFSFQDEIDAYPMSVQGEGNPLDLADGRTAGQRDRRKIFRVSTPLETETSRIWVKYREGDQRRCFVPCRSCGHMQELEFRKKDSDTGEIWGLWWEMEEKEDRPDLATVRYLCKACGHAHREADKTRMLKQYEWRPTAVPKFPEVRSYHLSALYSPRGMLPWRDVVIKWCEAWDVKANVLRDHSKLRTFYNLYLGRPFSKRGKKLDYATVSLHRRHTYLYGEIPNEFARTYAGGPAALLITTVDVHKHNLKVAVHAWCPEQRPFLIDYLTLEGNTEESDDPRTWGALEEMIRTKTYESDDGRSYHLPHTLIDSGYNQKVVTDFCARFDLGATGRAVMPIKGQPGATTRKMVQGFRPVKFRSGHHGTMIMVDLYKDDIANHLLRRWTPDDGHMPPEHCSFPADITDRQLKELANERREVQTKKDGTVIGWEWKRRGPNELWDLQVYSRAGLDMVSTSVCIEALDLPAQDLQVFFAKCEEHRFYWRAIDP